jgi:putative hemolysin
LIVIYGLIIAACLVLSAFFSSAETALLRVHVHDLDTEEGEHAGPATAAARSLLSSTSRLLITILFGNNVTNILAASVSTALAIHLVGSEVGIPTATALVTVVVLIFCEIIPKTIAASHPAGVSKVVALPLYFMHKLFWPLHSLIDRVLEPIIQRFTGGHSAQETLASDQLLRLARAARDSEETKPLAIIGATSAAAEMTVTEIMVPRTEMSAFSSSTTASELLEELLEDRFTRVPIYEDNIDNVLGVIHLKDLIKHVRSGATDLQNILKPVIRVPERKSILDLLADMQRGFIHVAIVKDEFAVTQGMVTQEDILEEIVGEIRDEFDSEELHEVRRLSDGSFDVLARVSVLDFNRESNWEIPAERGDTLGGLFFNTLERAPRKGEVVHLPGYDLQCLDVSGTRITRVRITQRLQSTEE